MIALGGIVPSIKDIRDTAWNNLKRKAVKKYNDGKKTGAAGSKLTELDNIVLDIVGRESVKINALNIEDTPISFSCENNSNQRLAEFDEQTYEEVTEVVVEMLPNVSDGPSQFITSKLLSQPSGKNHNELMNILCSKSCGISRGAGV